MPEHSSCFFANAKCEYFPCHIGIDPEDFNCLFCYCPLNPVINCGGAYTLTKDGKKDCSKCLFPHRAENYPLILERIKLMLDKRKFPEDWEKI